MVVNDPTGENNNGLPTFAWGCVDRTVYATRRQLSAMGLRKGGKDVAAQMFGWCKGHRQVVYFYRIDQAKPRRPWTAAKQEAVMIAARSRYRCDGPCHRQWPDMKIIPRFGLCDECRYGVYGPLTEETPDEEQE